MTNKYVNAYWMPATKCFTLLFQRIIMEVMRKIYKGPSLKKDKGFAWVILMMSFLSHGVHLGFSFGIIGNLTIAHQKFFNIDLETSSLMGSVHIGLLFGFCKYRRNNLSFSYIMLIACRKHINYFI